MADGEKDEMLEIAARLQDLATELHDRFGIIMVLRDTETTRCCTITNLTVQCARNVLEGALSQDPSLQLDHDSGLGPAQYLDLAILRREKERPS